MSLAGSPYRISRWGSFRSDWEFHLILILLLVFFFPIMRLLSTWTVFLPEPAPEENYARIEMGMEGMDEGGGGAEVAQPEQAAAPEPAPAPVPKAKAKPKVSQRKAQENREQAQVNAMANKRNQILQQSLVGVIATQSRGPSALGRILSQGGLGSSVDESLKGVKQGDVYQYSNGSGAGGSRGDATGGPVAIGNGKGGLGTGFGKGGLGTGFGGKGDGINLGVKAAHKVTASLQSGRASIEGSLDAALIDQVVRANLGSIKYCYEKELTRNPKLAGKIIVQFTINLLGEVVESRIENSSLSNVEAEDCIVRRIRRWKFPKPQGGSVIVSYPFVFTASS